MEYYAHTQNDQGNKHSLEEHLLSVAAMASKFSKDFYHGQFERIAWLIGLLHDIGKVNPLFQKYLQDIEMGVPCRKTIHAPWSALFAHRTNTQTEMRIILGLPIAGHHSGLDEYGISSAKIAALGNDDEMLQRMFSLVQRLLIGHNDLLCKLPELDSLRTELLIRMLFSALIDADRLDTEAHMSPKKSKNRERTASIGELVVKFNANQQDFMAKYQTQEITNVNQHRMQIYHACIENARGKPGLYRLTVPTGGGKTRNGLAFALEHAWSNNQQRIIFALPYTSIIDQTVDEYRGIFGHEAVLEHHSALVLSDDEEQNESRMRLRLAEENWDVPLIVTTNVQILESLFSNNPSRCRKIHRLANSVIVFDEAQTIPTELLKPTFQAIRDLIENYGTTVILSTATQPALGGDYLGMFHGIDIKEIVPNYKEHYESLKRTKYKYLAEALSIEKLANTLSQHQQVLVILNTRKDAVKLMDTMKDKESLHLSTLLCAAHRREILTEVRKRLDSKLPIRLISTQVIEAGVDIDFPAVYRCLGPLDRIVQAGGRCNREGGMSEPGLVTIFQLLEGASPGGHYKAGIELARLILTEYPTADILNQPFIFDEYFTRLYKTLGSEIDKYDIQSERSKLNYPVVANKYRLIKDNAVPVIVKYGDYNKAMIRWENYPGRDSWRGLQPFIVNISEWESRDFIRNGLMTIVTEGLYMWEGVYDEKTGISGAHIDPADLIV